MKKLKCLYIYIYISILCAIFSPCALQGQGQFTTLGDDFWLTFGNNYLNGSTLQLRFVASETTQVNLFFTANTALNRTINVAAGAVHTLSLNATEKAAVYNPTSATSWNSLHVTSNHNIALFAINIERATTDATNILPTNNLGTDYYHMSYQGVNGQGDGLCIVATENGTVINDAGTNVNLNAGQVYSRFFGTGVDNTGRHIISNRPIAYFTTNGCVTVPNGTPFCDCLYQQLVPVPLWGNNFLVPVTNRGRDRVRIIASQNTTINQTGGTVISGSLNLTAGQFVELEINQANNGCYIVANRPVAVGAYLMGADIFNLVGDARGDPAMAWIPPIQQSVAHTLMAPFIAINTSVLRIHYAMVIAPTAHRAATEVSESGGPFHGLGTTWTTNTASGYSYYSMPLADNVAASYEFRNPNGLMILGYGLGNDESYYYMAAASARQLDPAFYINSPNFPAEIHFQDANGQSYCNAPFTFRASIQYPLGTAAGRLKWYIGGPGGAGETEYMPARDLLEWTMPIDGLLGTHRIRLHITDSYNQTKDVITEFTVLPVPTAIPASDLSAAAICQNTAPTVRVANTNAALTYRVWNALTGGTNVGSAAGTGGTINIACTGNLSANTTYYVESFNGVCPSSPRTAVAIPVTTRPTVPALTAAAICNGSAPVIHLASSVSGVDYNVYTASTGGVAVGSASGTGSALDITLTETPSSNKTYYVEAARGSCLSTSRGSVSVTVNAKPSLPAGNVAATNVSCNGANDGSITVTGFAAGHQYSIDGGTSWQSSASFIGLSSGTYSVKVKNSSGCASDAVSKTITENSAITASVSLTHAACAGAGGTITVTAGGGTTPYQYKLDGGSLQSSNLFNSVTAGAHSVTVRDNVGCEKTITSITINEPTALTMAITVVDRSCNSANGGTNDGSISIAASGGTPAYVYSINGGSTWQASGVFSGLSVGTYYVITKDANGCTVSNMAVLVKQPIELEIEAADLTLTHISCNGGADGSVTISGISGGTAPYEYSFDGGISYGSGTTHGPLPAGTYTVYVRDSRGCTANRSYTLNQPNVLLTSDKLSFPLACPQNAKVRIANSQTGVTYSVYDSRTGGTLRGSAAGNGGTLDITVNVSAEPDSLFVETFAAPNCTSVARVGVKTNILKTLHVYPDIRMQLCPSPARSIYLSGYLDTMHFVGVTWTRMYPSSPNFVGNTATTTGELSAGSFTLGTHVYRYNIQNTCATGTGTVYIKVIQNSVVGYTPDTVVVCRTMYMSSYIQLTQMLGYELNGQWTYDPAVSPFVGASGSGSPFEGSYVFNARAAWDALKDNVSYKYQYLDDANSAIFKFKYNTGTYASPPTQSCVGNMQKELVIIVTTKLFPPH